MAIRKPILVTVNRINEQEHPILSDDQILYLCTRGNWLINAALHEAPIDREMGNGDCSVYAGQGIKDLDTVQNLMNAYPWGRFSVDVGGPGAYDVYIYIGTNDIEAMKSKYEELWGDVNRPRYWQGQPQTIQVVGNAGSNWV